MLPRVFGKTYPQTPGSNENPAGCGVTGFCARPSLLGNLVAHGPGQQPHRPLHEGDRGPLARTAVTVTMIAATLGNEVEGATTPPAEPFWPELFWVTPRSGVVVGTVQVQ